MASQVYRRYTELPYLLHILQHRELALPSPSAWDDKNDAHFMEAYRKRLSLPNIFALCFAECTETYHHWKVFCPGSSGVCIKFHKTTLEAWANRTPNLRGQSVVYKTLERLQQKAPATSDLPFLKRYAFRDEKEYRLIFEDKVHTDKIAVVPLPIDLIEGVTINPWLPREVFRSVRDQIRSLDGCDKLKIRHSTVVQNQDWKAAIEIGA